MNRWNCAKRVQDVQLETRIHGDTFFHPTDPIFIWLTPPYYVSRYLLPTIVCVQRYGDRDEYFFRHYLTMRCIFKDIIKEYYCGHKYVKTTIDREVNTDPL